MREANLTARFHESLFTYHFLFLPCNFLLSDGHSARAFAGAGVCVRSLTAHRQASPVSQAAVTTDVHQSLDVHLDLLAKISFDPTLLVNDISNSIDFFFSQLADTFVDVYSRFTKNLIRTRAPYPVNIRKANFRSFVSW